MIQATPGSYDNVGLNLYRSNGQSGVEVFTDADYLDGSLGQKQLFNYQLSNYNFEPQFTNGNYLYYDPWHPMLVQNFPITKMGPIVAGAGVIPADVLYGMTSEATENVPPQVPTPDWYALFTSPANGPYI